MDTRIIKSNKPSPKNSLFSIIVPTWNNLELLKLLIKSIEKNSSFSHQIIVHINENIDGTKEWIDTKEFISYTYSEENIGICAAVNLAASLAQTDYIVYLNDDMYLCPKWDFYLYEEIKTLPDNKFYLSSTMIEPIQTGNKCVIVKDYGKDVEDFKEQKLLDEFHALEKKDWNGSSWPPSIMHKDIWTMVGGFSIEYSPGMYSDPDLSMKLWLIGIRYFKGIGESKVYHFGSKSTSKVKKNKGSETFLNKWGMTSSIWYKSFLKLGEPFYLLEEKLEISFSNKLKLWFKKLMNIF